MMKLNKIDAAFLAEWHRRAKLAEVEAHRILSKHEQSVSRVIILEELLYKLEGLPIDVQDYFKESVICLERNLLRAAVVLSWAGFLHVLVENMYTNHEAALRNARPNWQFNDLTELKENYVEYQLIETARKIGLINKAEMKVLQGQLAERNRCAHPTLYKPSLNSALGFVDSMLRQTLKFL